MNHTKKIILLGSGELGRELVMPAKRLGAYWAARVQGSISGFSENR